MFITKNAPKILFIPIGLLLASYLMLIMGCNGGAHKVCLQQLEIAESQRAKALERAKTAESKLDTALENLETATSERDAAESKLDTALENLETATSERDTAKSDKRIVESQRAKALERAKTAESKLDTALENLETATSERDAAESKLDTALENLETATSERDTAKSDKRIVESQRAKALERAKTAESKLDTALENLETATSERDTAKSDKRIVESQRAKALERAKTAEEKKKNLEKLVHLVPQATITNVRIAEKKKDIDIFVTFNIKNRKGSKGSVEVSFHFANERPLQNKNGPISISEEFTPKSVNENPTVKLSMSYAELNVAQPSKLEFRFRIYDKSTESFLDGKPYSKSFSFNPYKN